MIKSLVKCGCFKNLDKEINALNHAYLFYSNDENLNNELAYFFALKIFCKNSQPCFECDACKRGLLNKNPDLIVIDKSNIVVDDVQNLLDKSQLKPMIYSKKIILIKNAEKINEIAQNKLLKSLEEPNESLIFILTTTNEEKLLATLKSRLKKVFLSFNDYAMIEQELLQLGVKREYINNNFTITEMFDNSNDKNYLEYVENVKKVFLNLKSTKDIPNSIAILKLDSQNKYEYVNLLAKLFDFSKDTTAIFGEELIVKLKSEFSLKLSIKVMSLIEDAYKKLKSNVNANYVFDILFYNILKEKYLCKQ